MLKEENQLELMSKDLKKYEKMLVDFYLEIGRKSNLNLKLTKIFAYLKIYESLTQKQLKYLTNFSLSTISSALFLFIQANILTRKIIPNTHTNCYTLKKVDNTFSYIPRVYYTEKLLQVDDYIEEIQQKLAQLQSNYPGQSEFLIQRLNGLRNYIEIQRRVWIDKEKNQFFDEDVTTLIQKERIIEYTERIIEIEDEIVNHFVINELFVKDDPIINKILSFLITRMKIDQETLIKLTGFSRSTISRNLSIYKKQDYTRISKKEYAKPRIYFMSSISLYLLDVINRINLFTISWIPHIKKMIDEIQSISGKEVLKSKKLLLDKLIEILDEIKNLKKYNEKQTDIKNKILLFLNK